MDNFLGHDAMQGLDKFRKSGELMIVTVALLSTFHYLLARWAWPEAIESLLLDGIARASGRPWREAVAILWEQAATVASHGQAEEKETGWDEEDGFNGDDQDTQGGAEVCP